MPNPLDFGFRLEQSAFEDRRAGGEDGSINRFMGSSLAIEVCVCAPKDEWIDSVLVVLLLLVTTIYTGGRTACETKGPIRSCIQSGPTHDKDKTSFTVTTLVVTTIVSVRPRYEFDPELEHSGRTYEINEYVMNQIVSHVNICDNGAST